jgi:Protein kinase domain
VSETTQPSESALRKLEPGSVFAGYRIERLLDRGGMGVVYMATEIDLDRVVALKIIAPEHTHDPTAIARFKSEARLAASLEHPNIVPIHRGGEHQGVLFLAMRFVPGTNLRHIIDRGPMELPHIARLISEIASALDAAHARGLIHRDVKPANILVSGAGQREHVYLTDFGLTKRLGSTADLTRAGGWVGTPDYVAPEQIQGHAVDRRADVYSLGCVLFEMLTGHVAYPKDSDMAKLWAHVTDPPPLPRTERPDLVEAFDEVVAKATAKDPDDRYDTADDLAAAVRDAVATQEDKRRSDAAQATSDDDDEVPLDATQAEPPAIAPPIPVAAVGEPAAASGAPLPAAAPPVAAPPALANGRDAPAAGPRRRRRGPLIGLAVLVAAGAAAAAIVLANGSSSKNTGANKPIATPSGLGLAGDLGPVPTNHVDGIGKVVVRLNGIVATVTLTTTGLLNAAVHPIHIHAGGRGICPPGSAAKRHNGHLAISTLDGVPFYGPPVTALTTRGDTSPKSILALHRFPTVGSIRYTRRIQLTPVVASYVKNDNAVIIVHGVDYNHNGVYDNTLDRSDLKRSLPGELTTPALCGPLVAQTNPRQGSSTAKTAQAPGHALVFYAALRPAAAESVPVPSGPAWWCPLHAETPGDVTHT